MSRIEYQTVLFSKDCITDKDMNNFGYDGWNLCSIVPATTNNDVCIGIFSREVMEEGLNAKIRNKLGPIQTLIDICKLADEGKILPTLLIQDTVKNAIRESEKSMEYLIHIGEE